METVAGPVVGSGDAAVELEPFDAVDEGARDGFRIDLLPFGGTRVGFVRLSAGGPAMLAIVALSEMSVGVVFERRPASERRSSKGIGQKEMRLHEFRKCPSGEWDPSLVLAASGRNRNDVSNAVLAFAV